MHARELAKLYPVEAIWVLGISAKEVENISKLTIEEINELSKCGRTLMRIKIPEKPNRVVGIQGLTILMNAEAGNEQAA
ncbi:hypothetical protein AADEFJLK_03533 [Methylovulum psychrotolerans]|uniref:Uncharacterized protein n=2 Tax=Methylovulum psychrotolerans TaxID=1704499 RepID=A0A2S5CIJ6_9GAMM|nr:hypothetical protein AADEFJLK_03533 [Methylovulum psychrotolerans]